MPRIDGRPLLGTSPPPAGLIGRTRECRALDELLDAVRRGQSRALVVRGDAGIGKSALLRHLFDSASGFEVLHVSGVESEMELPFAALHQLCGSMIGGVDALPAQQGAALRTAFGLGDGTAPDRLLIGLAVLSLLSAKSEEGPLLCVVDDAQWLDRASAQALSFVARRLLADPIGIVFAAREPSADFAGLDELVVEGLREGDAQTLLSAVLHVPLDVRVRDRIVAETQGNPLALVEWPRGLTPAELAGGFAMSPLLPMSGQLEENYRRRIAALPLSTQRLLTLAAADPTGDPLVVWRAASALGIEGGDASPAIDAGIVEIGIRVWFRHPLARAAAYNGVALADRRAAHQALASATDGQHDPDRCAWHRAEASVGPDEEVATELERSADRAQARGGMAASAAFLDRAVALTEEPERRARRALAAAQAKYRAGDSEAAHRLLSLAETGPLEELQRAEVDVLRAESAFTQNRGGDAPALLLSAAQRMEPLDVARARDTYLSALVAAHYTGRLARDCGVTHVAESALAASALVPRRGSDLLLDGWAKALVDGYSAGVDDMRRSVAEFRDGNVSRDEELRWLFDVGHIAMVLWDDDSLEVFTARHVDLARSTGALNLLPLVLTARVYAHIYVGEFADADRLIEETRMVSNAVGIEPPAYGPMMLAAWRGDPDALPLIDATLREARLNDEGATIANGEYARAVLLNAAGRYEEAFVAAEASERPELDGLAISPRGLPELIEAAVRTERPERATPAMERLSLVTRASGTDWALGIRARCEGLLSRGDAAEVHYQDAVERLGRTRMRPELARAHLLYGEWLRRENRRVDARAELRRAHDMLATIGLHAFAERARRELAATGETVRKRTAESSDELTPQEGHIAQLAAEGRTNPEIGAQLFISPRTVEWHLRKVFTKLGITSRRELRGALPAAERASA